MFAFVVANVIMLSNLFIGVVCSEFQKAKTRKERRHALSKPQQEWVMVHDLLALHRPMRLPREPGREASGFRRWCFSVFYDGPYAPRLEAQPGRAQPAAGAPKAEDGGAGASGDGAASQPFAWDAKASRRASQRVTAAVFALNVVSLCCVLCEYVGMDAAYALRLNLVQCACSALLLLNIGAKVCAIGLQQYLAVSSWSRLDLLLELATPTYCSLAIARYYSASARVGVALPLALAARLGHRELRLLGAVRALRFFTLLTIKPLHTVGAILRALRLSLPAVGGLVALLVCWVLAADFVAVSLFSGAVVADWYPDGEGLSAELSFGALGVGFRTLCVLLRFEGWTGLWADLLKAQYEPPSAAPPAWAVSCFFVVYLVTAVFMLLSVFVALLLDALEQLNATTGITIDQHALRGLCEEWSRLDPAGDQMLGIAKLGALLRSLGKPFVSEREVSSPAQLAKLLMHLDLPVYLPAHTRASAGAAVVRGESASALLDDAEVVYIEMARALAQRAVFADTPNDYALEPQLERLLLATLPKRFPIVRSLPAERLYTHDFGVARAIALASFDQAEIMLRRASSDDDGFFLEGGHDDVDFGLRQPALDGALHAVMI